MSGGRSQAQRGTGGQPAWFRRLIQIAGLIALAAIIGIGAAEPGYQFSGNFGEFIAPIAGR